MGEGKKTIVLVEDQEILARLIEAKLTRVGYEIKVAYDGIEGLRLIRAAKPDLVLLDMGLPHLDGFGVLEALAAEHILPALPIIIISNTGQNIEIDRAKKLGVREYLIKVNFNPDELVAKVERLFADPLGSEASEIAQAPSVLSAQVDRPTRTPTVLIVDDEVFFVELLEQKFTSAGFAVRHAGEAVEARAALALGKVDVILLDLLLPGVDGLTFLRELRATPGGADIPVIVTSNLSEQEEIQKAKEAGADDYLVKAHVDTAEIVAKVRSLLAK